MDSVPLVCFPGLRLRNRLWIMTLCLIVTGAIRTDLLTAPVQAAEEAPATAASKHIAAFVTLDGTITEEANGALGFGYDPVFFVPALGKTLAQLSADQKNKISHRAKAFTQAKDLLQEMEFPDTRVGA